jgi:F0F1-type ATP synthase membrane subunit b/b'
LLAFSFFVFILFFCKFIWKNLVTTANNKERKGNEKKKENEMKEKTKLFFFCVFECLFVIFVGCLCVC